MIPRRRAMFTTMIDIESWAERPEAFMGSTAYRRSQENALTQFRGSEENDAYTEFVSGTISLRTDAM
jgi:hypothetical protein